VWLTICFEELGEGFNGIEEEVQANGSWRVIAARDV